MSLKKNTKIQFINIINFNLIYYFRIKIICRMEENKNRGKNRNGIICFCLNESFFLIFLTIVIYIFLKFFFVTIEIKIVKNIFLTRHENII